MPFILLYFIKLSVSIAVVFLFYYFVLRRLTFYNWNRAYLMVYTALGFVIAFMNIEPVLKHSNLANTIWVEWLPPVSINNAVVSQQNTVQQAGSSWNINEWIIFIILTGMAVLLLRLVIQVFSVRRMIRKAEHCIESGLHFYQVNETIIPFSFGNAIFVNKDLHTESELQKIICHEFVHVKQKHSIDIFWAEFLCLINWYNPFAWLIKKAIRQNLEFIADDKVLQTGIAKTQYQYLLLKVVGSNQFSIAPKFNFSSLKKRIAMMNKIKTARVHLIKFLFVLPLIAVLLFAFRNKESDKSVRENNIIVNANTADTVLFKKPAETIVVPKKKQTATVTFKDVASETYNIQIEKEKQRPENKYSKLVPPVPKQGFTGLQGLIFDSGNAEEDITPRFVSINGKPHYYTKVENKITYYNLYGQEIDIKGKVLSTIHTNASDVLPYQYILKVYKDGELISSFNDDKAGSVK